MTLHRQPSSGPDLRRSAADHRGQWRRMMWIDGRRPGDQQGALVQHPGHRMHRRDLLRLLVIQTAATPPANLVASIVFTAPGGSIIASDARRPRRTPAPTAPPSDARTSSRGARRQTRRDRLHGWRGGVVELVPELVQYDLSVEFEPEDGLAATLALCGLTERDVQPDWIGTFERGESRRVIARTLR